MIYPLVRELVDDGFSVRVNLSSSKVLAAGLLQMGKAPNLVLRL
jgi:hypothetical protein